MIEQVLEVALDGSQKGVTPTAAPTRAAAAATPRRR
jgi:hypothetical protein